MAKTYIQQFEKKKEIFFLHNSKVLRRQIKDVYFNCGFHYKVRITIWEDVWLEESKCFDSIETLFQHWASELKVAGLTELEWKD